MGLWIEVNLLLFKMDPGVHSKEFSGGSVSTRDGRSGVLYRPSGVSWFACRARDYSAPVNFISAGLKKGAAEEAELEDSDDEEKPVKQDDFPKDYGPKKLKTVHLYHTIVRPKHLLASWALGQRQSCGFLLVVAGFCECDVGSAVSFLS